MDSDQGTSRRSLALRGEQNGVVWMKDGIWKFTSLGHALVYHCAGMYAT